MKVNDFAFYSDIGGRTNNEDSFLAKKTQEGYLFIVADGLGGHADGEIASRLAVDVVKEGLLKDEYADLQSLICEANQAICNKQDEAKSSMRTTIAVVSQHEYKTSLAHVGDTRIYAFKNGKIIFQTNDHSSAQMAVIVGEINIDQIRSHPDRNMLTRVLGTKEGLKVELDSLPTDSFDSLLLCSDGFWEYVLEEDMQRTRLSSKDAKTWLYKMHQILIEKAPADCDNNTAITVIIDDK